MRPFPADLIGMWPISSRVNKADWIATAQLELLHRLARNLAVIGVLVNPSDPDHDLQLRELQEAGTAIGQQIDIVRAATAHEIDAVFASLVQQGAAALIV